jgi:hypothetical protein
MEKHPAYPIPVKDKLWESLLLPNMKVCKRMIMGNMNEFE